MNSPKFWYDGQLISGNSLSLATDDPGLLYGATVFSTLRVYDRSLQHPLTNWQTHCDRICQSLQTFGWGQPDWQRLCQGAELLAADHAVLRVAIFPDGREWILPRSLPVDLAQRQQQGIVAWLADAPHQFRRSIAADKTGNYLPAWLAIREARQQGAQEAILVASNGQWLETSTGNLWGWVDGEWWTPPLTGEILPGLARSQLIQWLIRHNRTVVEAPWTPEQAQRFTVLALTNSVVEVVPIHTVLGKSASLNYDPNHPALEILRARFQH